MAFEFSNKKALVIDDFSEFRFSLKKMLKSFGVSDIDDVATAEEALFKLESKNYDIILCDYNLGEDKKDGQQLLEEAKCRKLISNLNIFMMLTAESGMNLVMGAIEYQPDDYLIKPVSKELIKNRLDRLILKKKEIEDIEKATLRKDYLEAIALCEERIDKNIGNIFEFLRLKNDLMLIIGDYTEARVTCEKALISRNIPWAKTGLGITYFLTKDFIKAKEILYEVIEETPTYIKAYDWLAKALEELGEMEAAQQVLQKGAKIAPKSVLRQRALGEVAYKNNDHILAEKAFKSAIAQGKNSFLKNPDEYTGLAKVLVSRKSPDAALKIIGKAAEEFKHSTEASLQTTIMEAMIYKDMGKTEEAKKSAEKAVKLYETLSGGTSAEVAIELANVCFAVGSRDRGNELMRTTIRNHHEDENIMKKAGELFAQVGMQEEGSNIIASARKEIVQVNNDGVRLVKEARLAEAIDYFEKAVSGLPWNKVVYANAIQTLIMFMQKNGKTDQYLYRTRSYLDRLRKIDPSYEKYQQLMGLYEKLVKP